MTTPRPPYKYELTTDRNWKGGDLCCGKSLKYKSRQAHIGYRSNTCNNPHRARLISPYSNSQGTWRIVELDEVVPRGCMMFTASTGWVPIKPEHQPNRHTAKDIYKFMNPFVQLICAPPALKDAGELVDELIKTATPQQLKELEAIGKAARESAEHLIKAFKEEPSNQWKAHEEAATQGPEVTNGPKSSDNASFPAYQEVLAAKARELQQLTDEFILVRNDRNNQLALDDAISNARFHEDNEERLQEQLTSVTAKKDELLEQTTRFSRRNIEMERKVESCQQTIRNMLGDIVTRDEQIKQLTPVWIKIDAEHRPEAKPLLLLRRYPHYGIQYFFCKHGVETDENIKDYTHFHYLTIAPLPQPEKEKVLSVEGWLKDFHVNDTQVRGLVKEFSTAIREGRVKVD